MPVLIRITDELGEMVGRRAAARGLALQEYVREVLERDANIPTLRDLLAPTREEVKAASTGDEELGAQIEEALSEVRARRRA
ncbi:MAG TPA: hypothetical protein VI756_17715 [Blastocatellia bacterium]